MKIKIISSNAMLINVSLVMAMILQIIMFSYLSHEFEIDGLYIICVICIIMQIPAMFFLNHSMFKTSGIIATKDSIFCLKKDIPKANIKEIGSINFFKKYIRFTDGSEVSFYCFNKKYEELIKLMRLDSKRRVK